jgi:hypothetical protein
MSMPRGRYYIGDLCYVFSRAEWVEVCNLTANGLAVLSGEFTLSDGRRFAMYSTEYGDGVYYPENGGTCPVDSGTIGCIRIRDIRPDKSRRPLDTVGVIVTFKRKFETRLDGTFIQFGHVLINTG